MMWEDNKIAVPKEQYRFVQVPKYAWKVQMGGNYGLTIMHETAPNWFHRKMQELILGFKWSRLEQ